MNRHETLQTLAILRVAYPAFYKSLSEEDQNDTVLLWCEMFKDDAFMVVSAAIKALVSTDDKGYPPHIGAVKNMISKLTEKEELTEMEAWNIVRGKMSAYATREDFLSLPPAIQRAVGSASQLCQWGLTDMESLPVIMSNFMRSYRAARDTERERKRIPVDVLKLIEAARGSESFAIAAADINRNAELTE